MIKKIVFLFLLLVASIQASYAQNITVIGVGRVGLTLALCLENAGYDVLGVDVSQDYVDLLNSKELKTNEPNIEKYLAKSTNFKATTSLKEGLNFSDVCFIMVSTTHNTDLYCLDDLTSLLREIESHHLSNKHVILCSTVIPGYYQEIIKDLFSESDHITFSYNPPFIAQGTILEGLRNPDVVLIGEEEREAGDLIEEIYQSVCLNPPFIARMSIESAEIMKMALNCFLTMKISFANLVGDLADATPGADKYAILKAIGSDNRIGSKYILPGYGYGGPCFTRDNRTLSLYSNEIGIDPTLFEATDRSNDLHTQFMAERFLKENLEEYIFEDISYKENCPVKILEASQKLAVAKIIAETGKKVIIVDVDEVLAELENQYGDLFIYESI